MLIGDVNVSSEPPAGGRGHDSEPALPHEELRTELHPQDEDGSAGRRTTCRWWGKKKESFVLIFFLFVLFQVLCLDKDTSSPSDTTPSSVQVRKPSSSSTPRPSVSSDSPKPPSSSQDIPRSASVSAQDLLNRRKESDDPFRSPGSMDLGQGGGGGGGGHSLAETGRSTSNLAISGSQQYLAGGKEPTPSIASDISNPFAVQELQTRIQQLQK